jgi:hypothetical protein
MLHPAAGLASLAYPARRHGAADRFQHAKAAPVGTIAVVEQERVRHDAGHAGRDDLIAALRPLALVAECVRDDGAHVGNIVDHKDQGPRIDHRGPPMR